MKQRAAEALGGREKFLRYFPGGFSDPHYVEWERAGAWEGHQRWRHLLGRDEMEALMNRRQHGEIVLRALRAEAKARLLCPAERAALRETARHDGAAAEFARGLHALLHGHGELDARFASWCQLIELLPAPRQRLFAWPVATAFPFLAEPAYFLYLKPAVTCAAAERCGFRLDFQPQPNGHTYVSLMTFARAIVRDLHGEKPRDFIDLHGYIWVQGSPEYPD